LLLLRKHVWEYDDVFVEVNSAVPVRTTFEYAYPQLKLRAIFGCGLRRRGLAKPSKHCIMVGLPNAFCTVLNPQMFVSSATFCIL